MDTDQGALAYLSILGLRRTRIRASRSSLLELGHSSIPVLASGQTATAQHVRSSNFSSLHHTYLPLAQSSRRGLLLTAKG